MSALTEQVAREHRTDYGVRGWSCDCGHRYGQPGAVLDRAIQEHRLEATEAATRAAVAAEIDSVGHHWSGAPALAFFALAADIREGKQP